MIWDEMSEAEKLAAAAPPRLRLPDRRERETIEIEHVWSAGTMQQFREQLLLSVGRYGPGGRIGEVFIDGLEAGVGKTAERVTVMRHDIATLISIALQYGAPLKTLRDAMSRGEVNVMGEMRDVPHSIAGAVLDALVAEEEAGR